MPARVNDPRNWQEAVERDRALIAQRIERRKKAADLERRRRIAVGLFSQGFDFRDIAKQAGFSHREAAFRCVEAALRERRWGCANGEAWALRERERAALRNEAMIRDLTPLARPPKGGVPDLHAVDRLIKLEERRAKLIGLDAPARQEVSGPGGAPLAIQFQEVERIEAALYRVVDGRPELRDAVATALLGEPAPTNGVAPSDPPTNGTA